MKKTILSLLLLFPVFVVAQTLGINPKIRWVDYSEAEVVDINTKLGFATHIVLNDDEAIAQAVGGDSDGWEVDAKRGARQVFLKPRENAHNSNLIITGKRNYVFALNVISNQSKNDWQIVFRYPINPVKPTETVEMQMVKQEDELKKRLSTDNPLMNCHYSMQVEKNSEGIRPNKACDDGRFTYLNISNNREMPAVFRVNSDNTESIVNKHIEGRDTLVIHEVAERFVLRLGHQVIGIWNDAFDPEGNPPIGGVSKEGVQRLLRNNEVVNGQ